VLGHLAADGMASDGMVVDGMVLDRMMVEGMAVDGMAVAGMLCRMPILGSILAASAPRLLTRHFTLVLLTHTMARGRAAAGDA